MYLISFLDFKKCVPSLDVGDIGLTLLDVIENVPPSNMIAPPVPTTSKLISVKATDALTSKGEDLQNQPVKFETRNSVHSGIDINVEDTEQVLAIESSEESQFKTKASTEITSTEKSTAHSETGMKSDGLSLPDLVVEKIQASSIKVRALIKETKEEYAQAEIQFAENKKLVQEYKQRSDQRRKEFNDSELIRLRETWTTVAIHSGYQERDISSIEDIDVLGDMISEARRYNLMRRNVEIELDTVKSAHQRIAQNVFLLKMQLTRNYGSFEQVSL